MRDDQLKVLREQLAASQAKDADIRSRVAALRQERADDNTPDTNEPAALTETQLQAIDERLATTTPGPWQLHPNGVVMGVFAPTGLVGEVEHVQDEEVIARAPADIAALLADDRRLRAQVAAMRAIVEAVAQLETKRVLLREPPFVGGKTRMVLYHPKRFSQAEQLREQARALLATLADGQTTADGASDHAD